MTQANTSNQSPTPALPMSLREELMTQVQRAATLTTDAAKIVALNTIRNEWQAQGSAFRSLNELDKQPLRNVWRNVRASLANPAAIQPIERAPVVQGAQRDLTANVNPEAPSIMPTTPIERDRGAARVAAQSTAALMRRGEVIATGQRDGLGVLVITGRATEIGKLIPRKDIVSALQPAGLAKHAPDVRTEIAQLGDVMRALNGNGFVARVAKRGELPINPATGKRDIARRWFVGSLNVKSTDVSLGRKELVVDLLRDDTLRFTMDFGDTACVYPMTAMQEFARMWRSIGACHAEFRAIHADYSARVAGELFTTTALNAWMTDLMRTEYVSAECNGATYVLPQYAATVRQLIESVRDLAGRPISVVGIATEADVRDGLIQSLRGEYDALHERHGTLVEANKGTLGATAATNLLTDLDTLLERVRGYEAMLGAGSLSDVRASALSLRGACESVLSDGSQRAAMLDFS